LARIPADASPEVQASIRELWEAVDRITGLQVDFKGVELGNIGPPVQPNSAATKQFVLDELRKRGL